MGLSCDLLPEPARHELLPDPAFDPAPAPDCRQASAVVAGGCFWCTQAVFGEIDGVLEVEAGYCGGDAASASYERVCSGMTDHAEAIRIHYDPQRIGYGRLLKVFFAIAHDPTQIDRQGNDRGRQYRSVIFCIDDSQRAIAQAYIRQLDAAQVFDAPIATEVVPLAAFYRAEDYHQDYAMHHPQQPYIALVAAPKVARLREHFATWLRGRDQAAGADERGSGKP